MAGFPPKQNTTTNSNNVANRSNVVTNATQVPVPVAPIASNVNTNPTAVSNTSTNKTAETATTQNPTKHTFTELPPNTLPIGENIAIEINVKGIRGQFVLCSFNTDKNHAIIRLPRSILTSLPKFKKVADNT